MCCKIKIYLVCIKYEFALKCMEIGALNLGKNILSVFCKIHFNTTGSVLKVANMFVYIHVRKEK